MKGLVKGILAIGTAIVVGCVIYKKVKEEVNIIEEETQELTNEQQEMYNEIRAQVMKEMKPISRANIIRRFMITFSIAMFYIFINHNIAVKYNFKKEDVA